MPTRELLFARPSRQEKDFCPARSGALESWACFLDGPGAWALARWGSKSVSGRAPSIEVLRGEHQRNCRESREEQEYTEYRCITCARRNTRRHRSPYHARRSSTSTCTTTSAPGSRGWRSRCDARAPRMGTPHLNHHFLVSSVGFENRRDFNRE